MEKTRNPEDAFAFEFDGKGVVSELSLADDWASFVSLEEFGSALLLAYSEQHAQTMAGTTPDFVPPQPGVQYPRELRDEVVDLSRDVSALLGALASWTPVPVEPIEVTDRYRHITIQAAAGKPGEIKVNEQWLRQADYSEIETDVVEAFQAMAQEAPMEGIHGQLAGLQGRLADLVRRRNDHSRG